MSEQQYAVEMMVRGRWTLIRQQPMTFAQALDWVKRVNTVAYINGKEEVARIAAYRPQATESVT